jgi:hypothetical protein
MQFIAHGFSRRLKNELRFINHSSGLCPVISKQKSITPILGAKGE